MKLLHLSATLLWLPLFADSARPRVIVDTDIGDDIDDSFALAMLLADPRFDLRLIVTDSFSPTKRAEVLAKFLTRAGANIPIAIGPGEETKALVVGAWAGPRDLASYKGEVFTNSSEAIIKEVEAAASVNATVEIVVISPSGAIAKALDQAPWIAQHAKIYAMGGSLRHSTNGTGPPIAEWNILADVSSSKRLYAADWSIRDTPLDSCALAQLSGRAYQKLRSCVSPLLSVLMEMNQAWLPQCPWPPVVDGPYGRADLLHASSVLYDAVAVTLLDLWKPETFLSLENVRLGIADDGFTVLDNVHGRPVSAATGWKNFAAWEQAVVDTLCASGDAAAVSTILM